MSKVRGSRSSERLMYLEHDSLTDWQPVQLS